MDSFGEIMGWITVALTVVMYSLYIRDILIDKFKPHPFSWFLWLIATATLFLAQLSDGAGPGAWMNGVVTFFNAMIFILSFKNGLGVIKRMDIIVLIMAMVAILLWLATDTPLYSVMLLSLAVSLAYIPTLRKAYINPFEESIYLFAFGFFRHGLTLFAMDNVSIITSLSPTILVLDSIIIASFILWRRHALKK